jgi:hypothetical protein
MAITHWIGNTVADKENYFWKEDVSHQIGRRTPQEQFSKTLQSLMQGNLQTTAHGDELWIHSDGGLWLRINQDGTIEFGEAAA